MKPLNILSRSKGYRNLAGCLLYPRTFQVDAVVGHNDSATNPSHFIAMNLNGRIEMGYGNDSCKIGPFDIT